MPDSDFIEFHEETAGENAKKIVEMAVRNFKNRKPELVNIPQLKTNATVGYSVEAIKKCLDGVTNCSRRRGRHHEAADRVRQVRRSPRRRRHGRLQQPEGTPRYRAY